MTTFQSYLGVFWEPRELTFVQFAIQVRRFLEGLRELHPVFETWYVLGDRMNEEKPLGADLQHLDELMLERGWDMSAPKHFFTHLDDDGCPTANSTAIVGWSFSLVTEPERQRSREYVRVSIFAGATSPRLSNSVLLKVGDPASPLLDPVVSERVFRYMIELWNPDRALVTERAYRDAVHDSETKEQLGWLNYRADSSFVEFLPDGVRHEPLKDGILFRIGDGRVLGGNSLEEVQLGKRIQHEILARR
ncbi:Imm52 family immunity protein [Rathayibacter rathayi]|uniref:Imm52 family immunity protein n=1 Tax=Rathayibacter rathayi TaxID=33887 RepID=UPI0011B01F71|nr:Imm52 family immunity protein [Rathayibacter rathayi]